MTKEQYVESVLNHMPRTTPRRELIGAELRGHIEERLAHGTTLDDVLRQLGDPAALAESYLAEMPMIAARHGRRIVAKLVDLVAVVCIFCAVMLPAATLTQFDIAEQFVWVAFAIGAFIGGLLAALYTVLLEWRYGYTLGKYMSGLLVVRESGARISFGQAIVRQLPVLLQVLWVDAMFALFTDRRQRAFELLSKTRVVAATIVAEPRRATA